MEAIGDVCMPPKSPQFLKYQ